MTEAVLDASAVIALLQQEPGSTIVQEVVSRGPCVISAVNVAEVVGSLANWGLSRDEIVETLASLHLEVQPFDTADALAAGMLLPVTRPFGLSLGDRACLALAAGLALPVLTTDRAWANLPLGLQITIARPA